MKKLKKFRLDKRLIKDYILIVIGSAIAALGYVFFLLPLHIVPGGVTGISIILNKFFKTPFGLVTLGLNIPIFLMGLKMLGKIFGLRTVVGFALLGLFSDYFTYGLKLPPLTENMLIGSLFGGVLLGAGLGFVFRGGGSTGGTDIIGRIIGTYTNLSTGVGIIIVDSIIITGAGIAFKSIDAIFYGVLTLFLSSKIIDRILEGAPYARATFIFTEKTDEIIKMITQQLKRGATVLPGKGAYTKKDRNVIFCVVTKREIAHLRELIKEIDPNSFVVITEVYEVLGRGFKPRV